MVIRQNKGEWSELYAFIRLLKEGKIYAADESVNKIDNIFFPILRMLRKENEDQCFDYVTGPIIRICRNGKEVNTVSVEKIKKNADILFAKIFSGTESGEKGAFEIPELSDFLSDMNISKVKAPSVDKVDITMQVHDIKTGYEPVLGFSVKSDVGSPPTLLNSGMNTRFRYEIHGITDSDMNAINAIDKSVTREYMKERMSELFNRASSVEYHSMLDQTYEDNLFLIDSMLPQIYANFILLHFKTMNFKHMDCRNTCSVLDQINPLNHRKKNIYTYKIKKLLCASALGMTPGKEWNGVEAATGGYLIVKRDGEVLCYHLYNRNFFEDYLLNNTVIDRPSASRHKYGSIFKEEKRFFIDLNIQIRFKSISAGLRNRVNDSCAVGEVIEYIKNHNNI